MLCGRYRLERKLAEGAMGQVFEAVHLSLGNRVAIKVMQPQQKDVRVAVRRFHKEARILGAVKHPHAVLITDFDVEQRTSGSVPFLVTELLRGRSLDALLQERGRLPLADVERILVPLCDAVEEAHAQGIIHRDLKPSNVFLERLRDGSEVVKVLDFGIAKLLSRADGTGQESTEDRENLPVAEGELPQEFFDVIDDDGLATTLPGRAKASSAVVLARGGAGDAFAATPRAPHASTTESTGTPSSGTHTYAGLMVGTIPYMAPEQMTGDQVTRRADVHAVAVVAFEMLAGRLPFDGTDDDMIREKLADERPSLKDLGVDVPDAVDALLQRCFALRPAERPESVREVAAVLTVAVRAGGNGNTQEPALLLARQVSRTAKALASVHDVDVGGDVVSALSRLRDALLSAGASLDRARELVGSVRGDPPNALAAAQLELDDALVTLRELLVALVARAPESGSYLQMLWRRIDVVNEAVAALFDPPEATTPEQQEMDVVDNPLASVLGSQQRLPSPEEEDAIVDRLTRRLLSRDGLDAADALDVLLGEHLEPALARLQQGTERASTLLDGLWAHADALLLRDLGVERGALRIVPYLAAHAAADGRFPRLVDALRDRRGAVAVDAVTALSPARPGLRCLLLHPVKETRIAALAKLALHDLWTIIVHERAPLSVLRFLFEHLLVHGHSDHLKVFFFCVKDTILTAPAAELALALALVRSFFDVACFHEDLIFEPLVELERGVRARGEAAGLLDDSYVRAVGRFLTEGARDDLPLEHLRDIPLPIQRKLARDGRLLTTFISHPNERIARETIPHLLKVDDIVRFLRVVTIHRVVLIELSKRRRLFRSDVARIALLTNPRTPPGIARPFLGLLSIEQLKVMSNNRQMNPDVRKLVLQALART
jgi:serine/threonine protein kinase